MLFPVKFKKKGKKMVFGYDRVSYPALITNRSTFTTSKST